MSLPHKNHKEIMTAFHPVTDFSFLSRGDTLNSFIKSSNIYTAPVGLAKIEWNERSSRKVNKVQFVLIQTPH